MEATICNWETGRHIDTSQELPHKPHIVSTSRSPKFNTIYTQQKAPEQGSMLRYEILNVDDL